MGYKYATIDIETTGLDRYKNDITFVGIGAAQEIGENLRYKFFDMSTEYDTQRFIATVEELKMDKTKLIFQNGKFDTLFLAAKGFQMLPIHHDVMLLGTSYDLAAEHGLKAMAQRYLEVPDWDIKLKDKTSNSFETVKPYLKKDVQYTWELFCYFMERLTKGQKLAYEKLLLPAFLMYRKAEKNGIYLDLQGLAKVKKLYAKRQIETLGILNAQYPIKWNSTKELPNLLFNTLKMPTLSLSKKTGNPSADVKVLKKLAAMGYTLAQDLIDYKFYFSANSKFLNKWGDHASFDGRIHPSFNITNVVTGRTSCSNPNLQQVPRNKELRTLYTAPKGRVLIEADYSQIELRIAAHYSNDPTMIEIYRTGGDIHTTTAAATLGKSPKDVTKDDRNKAKAVNFGFLYGMMSKGFKDYALDNYGVIVTAQEAETFRQLFFQKYNRLLTWHREMADLCEIKGGVDNMFGRFRKLPDIYSNNKWEKMSAQRKAINSPVQGTASDLLLLAAVEIDKELGKAFNLMIVGTVHDSILMDMPKEVVDEASIEIKRIMNNPKALDIFGIKFKVPIEADLGIGAWGSK